MSEIRLTFFWKLFAQTTRYRWLVEISIVWRRLFVRCTDYLWIILQDASRCNLEKSLKAEAYFYVVLKIFDVLPSNFYIIPKKHRSGAIIHAGYCVVFQWFLWYLCSLRFPFVKMAGCVVSRFCSIDISSPVSYCVHKAIFLTFNLWCCWIKRILKIIYHWLELSLQANSSKFSKCTFWMISLTVNNGSALVLSNWRQLTWSNH